MQTEAELRVDAVVVGGGALGLSTALQLALSGLDVALVERRTVGSQASGRAAGLFKSVQADELRTALARRSIHLASTFEEWAGVALDVRRSGSFLVARTPEHARMLRDETDASRRWGVHLAEADGARVADRTSCYRPTGSETALWCPEDVYIEEPRWLVEAYAQACARLGVRVLEDEPVLDVPVGPDGAVRGVVTAGRRVHAPVVVDAAGAWVRQVAALAVTPDGGRRGDVAVAPVRHQLRITEPTDEVSPGDPITRVLDAAVYMRPSRGGLMVGGFEAEPMALDPREQPAGFGTDDVPVDAAVLDACARSVADVVPAACGAVAEQRAGMFTMSPDGRFVAGPVPDLPGLWVLSGCNGSGFSSSPALGEQIAAWVVHGRPHLDMAALDPARFGRVTDAELVRRGTWQYAHYYDPAVSTDDVVHDG